MYFHSLFSFLTFPHEPLLPAMHLYLFLSHHLIPRAARREKGKDGWFWLCGPPDEGK